MTALVLQIGFNLQIRIIIASTFWLLQYYPHENVDSTNKIKGATFGREQQVKHEGEI